MKIIIDMYPENGTVPGIDDGVFEDHYIDVKIVFSNETTGFSEHPADLICGDHVSTTPIVLLEKIGVSDPEGVRLSGREFTASALKTLVSSSSGLPDLILHQSSSAVPEYQNPDLMPGMFPKLLPLGIALKTPPGQQICHLMPRQKHFQIFQTNVFTIIIPILGGRGPLLCMACMSLPWFIFNF